MTSVQIRIPDQQAPTLEAYAQAHGLTVERRFLQVAQQAAPLLPSDALERIGQDDRTIWEIFADFMKDVPPEIMATMPSDGASQHDHYLCGWPKREE